MSSSPSQLVQNEIVRAGAGAGKTTELVERILSCIESYQQQHNSYPRIVATTFTRKATQELRERLILAAQAKGNRELLLYVSQRSRLHISTIHGVLSLFLRRYGHLAELDAGFQLMSETQNQQQAKKQLKALLTEGGSLQRLVQEMGFQRVTELMLEYSRSQLVCPSMRPIAVVDLESQTQEHFSALSSELEAVADQILVETEQAPVTDYAKRLKDIVQAARRPWSATYWTELQSAVEALGTRPSGSRKNPPLSDSTKEWVKTTVEGFKKELGRDYLQPALFPEYAESFERFRQVACEFHQGWLNFKRQNGQFDMADLELLSLDVVRSEPELARAFASEWDYWLVDEYQDTSPLQVELLRHLMGERPSFVVGDPQQSIYLFRGAQSRVFSEREEQLRKGGGELRTKDKNYRSTPELLSFFNDFFGRLDGQFMSMQARQESFDPSQVVATFAQAPDAEDEPKAIVHYILKAVRRGASWDSFCILARTNKTLTGLAQALGRYGIPTHVHAASGFARRREVKDSLALLKFLLNPNDNLSLMILLRSPWLRVKDEQLVRWLSDSESCPEFTSHWQRLQAHPEAQGHEVVEFLRSVLSRALREPLSVVFQSTLLKLGVMDFSHHHDFSGRREANLWKLLSWLRELENQPGFNYRAWVEQIESEESSAEGDEGKDAVAAAEPNCVNLMTVHASKGLQFEKVILPSCHEPLRAPNVKTFYLDELKGLWSFPVPLGENGEFFQCVSGRREFLERKRQELEELKRLLYVALTRAQNSVFLSWVGEPKKNSWADLWDWPTAEEGLRPGQNYSFQVEYGPWTPYPLEGGAQRVPEVRPPYQGQAVEGKSVELLPRRSVSSLLNESVPGGRVQEDSQSLRTTRLRATERLEKAHQGVLLHRLFEVIHSAPQVSRQELIEQWFSGSSQELNRAVDYVLSLQEPPMQALIEKGQVEWGFHWRREEHILEGQIDLWGEINGVCWVVDYKSGQKDFVKRAFDQLNLYSQALRAHGIRSPIRMAVVYPLLKEVQIASGPGL